MEKFVELMREQPLLVNIYRLVSNKGNLEALDPKPLGNLS